MSGIGLAGAFLGGLVALLSPCSALLLPSFFAYAFDQTHVLVQRTAAFWLGLCLVLVPLGAGVAAVGGMVTRHREQATLIGGVVLIGIGVATALGKGFGLPGIQRALGRIRISSAVSVLALGAVYGLAGFCAGPLLGGVLTMSAMGGHPLYGGVLMGSYALGMAAPMFVLAALWDHLRFGDRKWLHGRPVQWGPINTHTTAVVSGALFVAIGVLFVSTDGTANIGGVLSVDDEYGLQMWLRRIAAAAGDARVLLGVVVILIAIVVARMWRQRRARSIAASEAPSAARYYRST
ncbi:cytochrome c biogenesis CcdA family protein [Mycolicibacterium sp. CBM1]